MAAAVSGTSMAPSSRRSSIGSSLSDDKPILIGKVCLPGWKVRRRAPRFLAARGNGKSSDLTIETPSVFDDFSCGVVSKDSSTLPRPLTTQLSNSVANGSRLRVAYQGVCGAYSESAAEKAYPNCEAVPCEQFDTAFEAVENWLVDRAVLPFENSLGGSIHRNYDLLLHHNLHIVGEVNLAVSHCLMANPGVEIEDLNRVLSHPQALAQCENTLTKLGLVREAVDDTAGAAKHVAFHKLKDVGAVASSAAADIYGLKILAQDVQDDSDNVTRFLMLAREPIIPSTDRPFKTNIVFSLEEGPGVLFKALAVFALRRINLTKIESRPLRNQPLRSSDENNGHLKYFDYLFYVDFEASMADQNAQNALRHLKEFATFLRVLGSYPADNSIVRAPPFLAARGNGSSSDLTIETPSVFDDFSRGVISKDSSTLPRPLTTQFSNSVADASQLRVAYQGVRGAYSESAAEKAYPNCEAVPCEQFDTAFEAVESWLVDRAVLPIENSLGGSIHRNYDLLLRHSLHIVGEVKLAIRHCLMANHGVEIEDLNRVLSHPQALAQCENTLTRLGLVREAVDDTAGAAKHVALHKLKDTGAVASSTAADIYDLKILAQDIQDDSDNVTRFLMLAREPIIPGTDRPFKTSIVFSLEEGPGVLFKALAVFALRRINLTKIESRPLRNQPLRSSDENNGHLKYFDYLFYVDFEASMADQNAQNALRHLKEFATFLRVLGSYPADNSMV